jgi:hypothetical protein
VFTFNGLFAASTSYYKEKVFAWIHFFTKTLLLQEESEEWACQANAYRNEVIFTSLADPGCLSRIPDPIFFHPGSELSPSRIPDPHQRI